MKTFYASAMMAFTFVPLLPFVVALDMDNFVPYLHKTLPLYLSVGIVGMLTVAYMNDKYQNKI